MNKIIIYYRQGEKDLTSARMDLLKPLTEVVTYPGTTVKINGHASTEDSDKFNMDLSKVRAEAVWTYLLIQGAKPEQLTVKWYGERQPVEREFGSGDVLEAHRAKNRRVEIEYIAGDKPEQNEYQALNDRYRERINKALEAFRWTSGNAKEKLRHVTSLPNKNAAVTMEWQSLIDKAKSCINEYETDLQKLDMAEILYNTPREVWNAVFKPINRYDKLLGYMTDMIKSDTQNLEAAGIKLAQAKDQDKKYYLELIEAYKDRIKRVKEEQIWTRRDKAKDDYWRKIDAERRKK